MTEKKQSAEEWVKKQSDFFEMNPIEENDFKRSFEEQQNMARAEEREKTAKAIFDEIDKLTLEKWEDYDKDRNECLSEAVDELKSKWVKEWRN